MTLHSIIQPFFELIFFRFLNCADGWKKPGRSILDVGVFEALRDSGFDHKTFVDRGGIYDWGGKKDPAPNVEW